MSSHFATRGSALPAAYLVVLLLASACSTRTVAHADWRMGAGPATIDLERPIIVEPDDRDPPESVDVLFPLLFYSSANHQYFGPCGIRIAKVDGVLADSLRHMKEAFGPERIDTPLVVPSDNRVMQIDAEGVQEDRWRRTIPVVDSQDINERDEFVISLYVEVEAVPTRGQATSCDGVTGTHPEGWVRSYLIDLGSARSVENSVWVLSAAVWGVIALGSAFGPGGGA